MSYADDKILGFLPNPFVFSDGRKVKNNADWILRRKEISDEAIKLEYGGMPPIPEVLRVELCCVSGENDISTYRIVAGTSERTAAAAIVTNRMNLKTWVTNEARSWKTSSAPYHIGWDPI